LIGLYYYLKQFSWSTEVLNVLSAIMSTEILVVGLYKQGKELQEILIWLLITDAVNISIDLLVFYGFLKSKSFIISLIKIFAKWSKGLISDIKKLIKERREPVNNSFPIKEINDHFNGMTDKPSKINIFIVNLIKKFIQGVIILINKYNPFKRINNQLNEIKNNPSKFGLLAIYLISICPRIPPWPPFPGGVAIAIFLIRYNKYGYIAWIALGCGIITRHAFTIGSVFGISSFF